MSPYDYFREMSLIFCTTNIWYEDLALEMITATGRRHELGEYTHFQTLAQMVPGPQISSDVGISGYRVCFGSLLSAFMD